MNRRPKQTNNELGDEAVIRNLPTKIQDQMPSFLNCIKRSEKNYQAFSNSSKKVEKEQSETNCKGRYYSDSKVR